MVPVCLLKSQEMITVSVAVVKPKKWFVASNKAVAKKLKMELLKCLFDQLLLLASDILFRQWPIFKLKWFKMSIITKIITKYLVNQIKVVVFVLR